MRMCRYLDVYILPIMQLKPFGAEIHRPIPLPPSVSISLSPSSIVVFCICVSFHSLLPLVIAEYLALLSSTSKTVYR